MTKAASPERILFASTTQSFLEKEASLSRLRELHAAGISFEPDWWRRAAELGWTSLLVPEELRRDHRADGVAPPVLGTRAATSVSVEAGDGVRAARLQLATQHITIRHGTSIA